MKRLVPAVFVATLLAAALQVVVVRYLREPYPALLQPSFGAVQPVSGTASVTSLWVRADYADGTSSTFSDRRVMAAAEVDPAFVFRSAFGFDSPRRDDPAAGAWLRRRLQVLGGGREPVRATVEERVTDIDLRGADAPTRRVVRAAPVDLGADRAA